MKYDIVIIMLPFVYPRPLSGPAVLKSSLENAGYSCKIIDWNFKLFESQDEINYDNFLANMPSKYSTPTEITKYGKEKIQEMMPCWLDEIKYYNPDWIGLSFNNYKYDKNLDDYFVKPIRETFPDVKIIAGGSAIDLLNVKYEEDLINKNYIDYYVKGEADEAIVSILKNGSWDNETSMQRIKKLDNYPSPDYSDFFYLENKEIQNRYGFPIISSRGCIRNCKFCMEIFKGSYRRDPKNVVDEIRDLYEKYKITSYRFNDPLINSNVDNVIEISKLIIEYKKIKKLPKELHWTCNFCCLPRTSNSETMYQKMGEAGCSIVYIGLESGSNKVRNEMNKQTKEEDIFFMLSQFKKNNVKTLIHIIVGYYTETEDDFQETLNFIRNISEFFNKNLIIDIGCTFQINKIELWEDEGLKEDGKGSWYYKDNTYPLRLERWLRLLELCMKLDINIEMHYNILLYNQLLKYKNVEPLIDRMKPIIYNFVL
jgi:radical SAM superfamily enzyme YgiQ (UPF0313 family)